MIILFAWVTLAYRHSLSNVFSHNAFILIISLLGKEQRVMAHQIITHRRSTTELHFRKHMTLPKQTYGL